MKIFHPPKTSRTKSEYSFDLAILSRRLASFIYMKLTTKDFVELSPDNIITKCARKKPLETNSN